ncbi:MAG: MBL fold metallo-hydrolase [Actinomycetes bacterium]
MNLVPVDALDITVIVDNVTDGLSSTIPAARSEMRALMAAARPAGSASCLCCAAHGLSLLVTVMIEGSQRTLLFDTGPDATVFERNVARLGIDLGAADELFLSHGHWDHCGAALLALDAIRARSGRRTTPVHAHPGMFRARGLRLGPDRVTWMDEIPSIRELTEFGGDVSTETSAAGILGGAAYSSGEIPRTTAFERGMPGHVARLDDGTVVPDEEIVDERWLGVHVRGLGLVLLTACSHAGIGNIVAHARAALRDVPLYAIVGGLHLAGSNEVHLEPSVEAVVASGATLLAPGHCTGWRAVTALAHRHPGDLQPLAVGMRLTIGADTSA